MVGAMANIPMRSGMVIVNPIPKEFEADEDMIDRATTKALREAEKNGITGRDVTPFLLARIAELTEGASLRRISRLFITTCALPLPLRRELFSRIEGRTAKAVRARPRDGAAQETLFIACPRQYGKLFSGRLV